MTVIDMERPNGKVKPKDKKGRIKLTAFNDIKLGTGRRWLVKNLVPVLGLFLLWGPPKSGKSFFIFDLAMHIALGWDYRGRRVRQGTVVYCAFEGHNGIAARVEAFRQSFLPEHQDPIPFHIVTVTLDLVREHRALIEAIRDQIDEAAPALIVLDTLNRSLVGSESKDEDMAAYIRATDALWSAFECCVAVVHHCGIDGTRPRGHTSMTGAADVQASCKKDTGGLITVETEFVKDGPENETVAFRLEPVTVGVDEDGDEITSCVVAAAEPAPPKAKPVRLSQNQQTMLSILKRAGPQGLPIEQWNDQARAAGLGLSRPASLFDLRVALQDKGLVFQGQNGWFAKREEPDP
jgi:hypothetical protein